MEKHERFTQWAKDQGVEIDGIEAKQLPGRGLGLITTRRLKKGTRIMFIPEKAMFKPDAALFQQEKLTHISPQAQLATSALLSFGPSSSPLKVWQETWPTLEDFDSSMPMCWSAAAQRLLPPPVHQPLERQLADYQKDWKAVQSFCTQRSLTEDDFKYYWMIVNSRSFHWKPRGAAAGSMVVCPFIDYLNHGPTGTSCHVTMSSKGYEVTTDRIYAPNEEVLATYGAHTNDKLLVHYGFILPHTTPTGHSADDDIRLDHLLIPKFAPEIASQLQDVGFLGGYAVLPAKNEICFKTQVAVRAMLLTCNEWEYFVASGEDLSADCSGKVDEYVRGLLREYRGQAVEGSRVEGMTGMRWRQIVDAIDAFVGR